MPQTSQPPPRSPWPWLILALWVAWLAAMIYMSRNEWGRARPLVAPDDETLMEKRRGDERNRVGN